MCKTGALGSHRLALLIQTEAVVYWCNPGKHSAVEIVFQVIKSDPLNLSRMIFLFKLSVDFNYLYKIYPQQHSGQSLDWDLLKLTLLRNTFIQFWCSDSQGWFCTSLLFMPPAHLLQMVIDFVPSHGELSDFVIVLFVL